MTLSPLCLDSFYRSEPANGTPVPTTLFKAQAAANRAHREQRHAHQKSHFQHYVSVIGRHLGLPESFETQTAWMMAEFIDRLEKARRISKRLKFQVEAAIPFRAVLQQQEKKGGACDDCKRLPVDGDKPWKKRPECGCRVCPRCSDKEALEEQLRAELEENKQINAKFVELQKATGKLSWTITNLPKPEPPAKRRKLFHHHCEAVKSNEFDHKRALARKEDRIESRPQVNAFISIAAACVYLHAELRLRSFRWYEITAAVEESGLRKTMQQDTLMRWVRDVRQILNQPAPSAFASVVGYANHYLDVIGSAVAAEFEYVKLLIAAVMRTKVWHPQLPEPEEDSELSMMFVLGRVYERILNEMLRQSTGMDKDNLDCIHLHNHQTWILAAPCVYLVLRLRRKTECITIEDLCKKLAIDQTTFQQCKRDIVQLI